MNAIVNFNVQTMSSREIAELTGKRHDHVVTDINKMLNDLELHAPDFLGTYKTSRGNEYQCFNLPKRETLILVSGYNIVLRAKIIDRWDELENRNKEVSKLEILQMALESEQQKIVLQEQVAILEPKAKSLDRIADTTNIYTIRECAKAIGIGERKLMQLLIDKKWVFRENGGRPQPYSDKVAQGVFVNRASPVIVNKSTGEEKVHLHMRVTAFGLTRITGLVNKLGVAV